MYQGKYQNAHPSGKGSPLFFLIYGILTLGLLVGLYLWLSTLVPKLENYELTHRGTEAPTVPTYENAPQATGPAQADYEKVFASLFTQPDWEALYTLAGEQATPFEGAQTYRSYMEARVGDQSLTCVASPQGYDVLLGDEKVAAFTLSGGALDKLELCCRYTQSVTVETAPGYQVYINGIGLDDSHTIYSAFTAAEDYLPQGVHGQVLQLQQVDGLLVEPKIQVLDPTGAEITMTREEETGIYRLPVSQPQPMTEQEQSTIRGAALADAKYSMRMISAAELKRHFHADSTVYKQIATNSLTIQKHKSHSVDESTLEISEFYRYSDMLYTARVKLTVKVIRNGGSLKEYPMDKTYFFTKGADGTFRVSDYTNQPLQEQREQVRLRFMGQEEVLSSLMVDTTERTVTLPQLADSEGLLGWASCSEEQEGKVVMTIRVLPDGTLLGEPEPLTLYPVYEKEIVQ